MNIDVFKAIKQLEAELSSVLEIDSIELQFEIRKKDSDKDLAILIFYFDAITHCTECFTTHIYKCDDKKLTLDFIKKCVLAEMLLEKIEKRLPAPKYSFNTSQK